MTELSIATPHHRLEGYLATPQGAGPWPGVIVLHGIFGLTDVTRGHADWLAKEGYLAVAPDLFSWGGRCPMVASFGGRDRTLKGAAARLEGALGRHLIDHDVREYPDAGHSFLDDHKGLVGVLGVVVGARYKDKDAADARGRIRAFFARHLA